MTLLRAWENPQVSERTRDWGLNALLVMAVFLLVAVGVVLALTVQNNNTESADRATTEIERCLDTYRAGVDDAVASMVVAEARLVAILSAGLEAAATENDEAMFTAVLSAEQARQNVDAAVDLKTTATAARDAAVQLAAVDPSALLETCTVR